MEGKLSNHLLFQKDNSHIIHQIAVSTIGVTSSNVGTISNLGTISAIEQYSPEELLYSPALGTKPYRRSNLILFEHCQQTFPPQAHVLLHLVQVSGEIT